MNQLAGLITEGQAKKMMQILNELLDSNKVKQLGKKSIEDYVLKNNLGSVESITLSGASMGSDKAEVEFNVFFSTGEQIKIKAYFDNNYNVIDIKPNIPKSIRKINGTSISNKIKGVKVNIDNNMITFSGRSGEYIGDIDDNGTISLEIFSPENEGAEEFDQYNWKDILGPNHVFVRIADSIPTKVEALGDSLGINFKASDVINMN